MHTHIGLRRFLIAALCSLAAACAGEVDEGFAAHTEINLDIVNPGGTSGELGFSIDRVDYRITCAGGAYLVPPFHELPSAPNGTECSTADLDNNGIPDSCPAGFNYIQGTAGPDNLVGTNGADCIYGLGGNDVIDGGNGGDYICGGSGDDTILGGNNGNDALHGGEGNDTLSGGNGIDALFGGPGDDALDAGNGNDLLDGGPGIDTLNGNGGTDTCSQEVPGSSSRLTGCESSYDDSVDISGAFEVVDTRVPPVWQAVMDLPPGDCTITLSVWEEDEIVCAGSQTLAIAEDATTKYDIVLVCSLSIDTPDGMADVDGTFELITGNLCPKLYVLNALEFDPFSQPGFLSGAEIQYRAKDPDNTCGHNCDPQSCTTDNPPVCTPYPSNINDPVCNPSFGGNPNDPSCLAGDHAGLVCTIAAFPSATPGVPGGTFISPADGTTPVGPILPV
ncbi:MAG TPA: calcium-binding protein, partial [Polyangiales bacterium]|nr:calcium-binding protein [Polyangiales bacterium]